MSRAAVVLLLIEFALLPAAGAQSTQAPPTLSLTLERALALSMQENPDLRVARFELDASHWSVTRSRGALLPQLSANGRYTRNIEKPVIFLPQGFGAPGGSNVLTIGYDNAYAATLSASLPLFDYSLYTGLKIAGLSRDLAEESLRGTRIMTVTGVRKAFYAALLAREMWRLAQASLRNAEENLASTRSLESQGLVAEYDLLRAEVQVDNARPAALQAEDAYRQAQDALRIAIGLAAEQPIEIEGDLEGVDTLATPAAPEAWNAVRAGNSTLRRLALQTKSAGEAVVAEKAAYLPALSAFGNFQYEAQANNFTFSKYDWISTLAVGVQISLPLFNGFGRYAQVHQARADERKAAEQQAAALETYRTQLDGILYNLSQAKARMRGQRKSIDVAERAYAIARARYRDGLGTQLEVNDAQLALTQTQANYLQAAHDYLAASAEYDALLGRTPEVE